MTDTNRIISVPTSVNGRELYAYDL